MSRAGAMVAVVLAILVLGDELCDRPSTPCPSAGQCGLPGSPPPGGDPGLQGLRFNAPGAGHRDESAGHPPDDPDRTLDALGRKAFAWFQKHRHPLTGLTLDRAPNRESFRPDPEASSLASIASLGYHLSLLPEW